MDLYHATPYRFRGSVRREGILLGDTGRAYLTGTLQDVAEAATDLYYQSYRNWETPHPRKFVVFKALGVEEGSLIKDPEFTSYGREDKKVFYTKEGIPEVEEVGIYDSKTGVIRFANGSSRKLIEPWD